MSEIKAFIFSGTQHQYQCFLQDNHLNRNNYPRLTEENWRGRHKNIDVIRIGTYFENKKMLDMLPNIEHYLKLEQL